MNARTCQIPDPRPQLAEGSQSTIAGWQCASCRHPLALPAPWCPLCHGPLETTTWGPGGTTWAATVLRVPLPGRTPPMMLAYIDLDEGPRVLGHLTSETNERPECGTRVRLIGVTAAGDLLFAPNQDDS